MHKYFFGFLLIFLPFLSYAQKPDSLNTKEQKKELVEAGFNTTEEGIITQRKSFVFGAKLLSDGYGVFFEIGRAQSVKKSLLYQLELSERKHPKQTKMAGIYQNLSPLTYGKINFFYPIKLGVQQQYLLGNKAGKNGVNITGNVGGGVVAGLLRPYYVQVVRGGNITYIKYDSADSADFISQAVGGPTFGKGWSEITVTPGLYAKAAVRFDYGRFNPVITALEVGVDGEYYTKKMPIMAYNDQKQFFFSAYVSILFGKRK